MKALDKYGEKPDPREKVKALASTLVFFGIVIVSLFLFGFKTKLPLPDEMGAYVMLGELETGAPGISSDNQDVVPQPEQSNASNDLTSDRLITQNVEDAPVIKNKTDNQTTQTTQNDPAIQPERQSDPRFSFQKNTTGIPGQGTGGTQGYQGSPTGDPNATNYGTGGGTGFSFNLTGRGLVQGPPKIDDNTQKVDKIVIEITVNREGKVTKATPTFKGGGTATTGPTVQKAINAAYQVRFSSNPDAFEEQYGTITFSFKLD